MAIIAPDIGIDLGTANTQVYVKKKGVVIDEPSILVVDRAAAMPSAPSARRRGRCWGARRGM